MSPARFIRILGPLFAAVLAAGCGGGGSSSTPIANPLPGTTYQRCDASGTQTSYAFASGGNGTRTVSTFAAADCSGTATSTTPTAFTYAVGRNITALDSQPAAPLDLTEGGTTTYTLFRLSGGATGTQNLQFGSTATSSAGKDGTSSALRHDGIDTGVTYSL